MKTWTLRFVGLLFVFFAAFPATAQTADDLVLLLPFDQGSGTTASDGSGAGNHGAISGATWVQGKYGQALQFDGVDDAVRVQNSSSLSFSNTLSVEAWVNMDVGAGSGKIAQKKAVSGGGPGGFIFGAWFANPAGYAFEVYDAQGQHMTDTGVAPTRGTWQHVVGTFDGSNIKIYLDGVLKKTTAFAGSLGANTDELLIGIQSNNLMPFKGMIDDFRIYRKALSDSEIACDMQGNITENGQCIPISQMNKRPTVTASGPSTLKANAEGAWQVLAADADGSTFAYSVDWGDGSAASEDGTTSAPVAKTSTSFTHRYVNAGSYNAVFSVADSKGAVARQTIAVTVTPPAELRGNILDSYTVREAESPYIVTSNVILYPNATLTVEPGSVIRFNPGTSLEIRGALVADGTADKRISFTAAESSQTKGSWNGIRVMNTLGGRASLKFADVSYAGSALSVECCSSGGPVTIADATFRHNATALGGYSGDVKVTVDRSTFENNTNAVTQADKIIRDSTFRNNTYGLYQTERISVTNSTFTGHTVALWGGRGTVTGSTITNNETGVQAFFEGFTLEKNTISNNSVGVILGQYDAATPAVKSNNIFGNTLFNMKNTGASNKTVAANWWGTTDPKAIDASIYDAKEDGQLGLLAYSPVSTALVDITGQTALPPTLDVSSTPPPAEGGGTLAGSLFESLTLTRTKSPYRVTADTTLFPGATMTIEPGVEIRFAVDRKITVRGNLVSEGTASQRIVFTADAPAPTKGFWKGISIGTNEGGKASLKFVTIQYAQTAISVDCCSKGGPISIADALLKENNVGLGGYAGDVKVSVDRTTFEKNTNAVTSADKVIRDSTFLNNLYGLYQTERVSVYASTFTNNEIAIWGGRGEVKQSTITGSGVAVKPNYEGLKLTYNTITGNSDGVTLGQYNGTSPLVVYNNIHGNTGFNLKNTGPSNKDAKNNWWGTTDTAAIERGIIDGRDQSGLGLVEYAPALTAAVDITSASAPSVAQPLVVGEGGLLGHWRFDGNGNNEVSGSPNAAVVGSAVFKSEGGKFGGYLSIPVKGDSAKIAHHSAFDLPSNFTVSFWFRQRADRSFLQNLVFKGTAPNRYNFYIYRQLWDQFNSGPVITGFTSQQSGFWTQTSNPNQLSHNEWHHVGFAKDQTQSAYYLDGKLIHSSNQADSAVTSISDIIVGSSAMDTDIDDLRIYNRALSMDQMQLLSGISPTTLTFRDITVSAVTGTSATISWKTSEAGLSKLTYGVTSAMELRAEALTQSKTEHTITLVALSPNTIYHYQPQTTDSSAFFRKGTPGTFTTRASQLAAGETPAVVAPAGPAAAFTTPAGAGGGGAGAAAAPTGLPASTGTIGVSPGQAPVAFPSAPLPALIAPQVAVETYKAFREIEHLREQLQRVEEFRGRLDEGKREELKQNFSQRIVQAEEKIDQGDIAGARALSAQTTFAKLQEQVRALVSPIEELKQLKERFKQAEKTLVVILPIAGAVKTLEAPGVSFFLLTDPLGVAADLAFSQKLTARAEELLKRGNKAAAQKFLERASASSPHDELLLEQGKLEALSSTAVDKFVAELKERIDRTARGISEADQRGVPIESAEREALEQAQLEVSKLEHAAERSDIAEVKEGLKALKNLDLSQRFSNFRQEALPAARMDQQIAQADARVKNMTYTLAAATSAGLDLQGLPEMKTKQEQLVAALTASRESGDAAYLGQALDALARQDAVIAQRVESLAQTVGESAYREELQSTLKRAGSQLEAAKALSAPARIRPALSSLVSQMEKTVARANKAGADTSEFEQAVADVTALGDRIGQFTEDFKLPGAGSVRESFRAPAEARNARLVGEDSQKAAAVSAMIEAVPARQALTVKRLFTVLDASTVNELLEARAEHEEDVDNLLATITALPAKHQAAVLKSKLDLERELDLVEEGRVNVEQLDGISEETLERLDEVVEEFRSAVFPAETNVSATRMLESLSDRLLQATDPSEASALVATAGRELESLKRAAIKESVRTGIAPSSDIDASHPLYAEARYLQLEGALPIGKGKALKPETRASRGEFATMMNRTLDRKVLPETGGPIGLADALRLTLSAYTIRPDFNVRDAKRLARFARDLRLLDVQTADLARPLTREFAVGLVVHADQKWGDERR